MRKGILAAGNFIIDVVKMIDTYPGQDSLSNILSESQSNGGSPYNILKDLYKLGAQFSMEACGRIGLDEKGAYIRADCEAHHINTIFLVETPLKPTSYTDVMTVAGTGRRTFFHNRGANALLSKNDIPLQQSSARIFHLAYLMLLDTLDAIGTDGTTEASAVFKAAKQMGFITTTDMVSENSGRFKDTVSSSFPFVDYLFINEFEAEKITGISTTIGDSVSKSKCIEAAQQLIRMGIQKYVILHVPKGCIAVAADGTVLEQASLQVPSQRIKGTVGAGDAFAAGILYGIHEQIPMQEALHLGVCSAASCLFEPTCSDGILPKHECLNLAATFGYQQF